MAETIELLSLRTNQQSQILDQYRVSIYTLELKVNLLNKLLEEKGTFLKGEFEKRWPLYLKNEIGVQGPDGRMDGSLKVYFYGK